MLSGPVASVFYLKFPWDFTESGIDCSAVGLALLRGGTESWGEGHSQLNRMQFPHQLGGRLRHKVPWSQHPHVQETVSKEELLFASPLLETFRIWVQTLRSNTVWENSSAYTSPPPPPYPCHGNEE